MHPLGTKAYLLKRYSPSDSFWTFFSESVFVCLTLTICTIAQYWCGPA